VVNKITTVFETVRDIWDELSAPPTLLSWPNTLEQLSSSCYPDEGCLSELYPDDELSYVHFFSGMFSALLNAFNLLFW